MIFVKLKGGLGNMMFQIAAGIHFSNQLNTELSLINLHEHLNYLNSDNLYQPDLKHAFEYLKLNQFKNFPPSFVDTLNTKTYQYPFEYINYIPPDNVIIDGFFQTEKYFSSSKTQILKSFEPTEEIKSQLQKYDFLKYQTTSIHVRRGDYLKFSQIHTVQNESYFKKALDITKNKTEKYIVFSDDIEWCKKIFINDNFIFIENEKDYIEIYLMSLCNNNIISNSSFSWWAAWMNPNDNKLIISPKNWFGIEKYGDLSDNDIIPNEWIKI